MINDLEFSSPESQGVDSKGIRTFIKRIKDRKVNLHSFMFYRNGKIISEAYAAPFDKNFEHRLYSSSKTYVSLAVGRLIGEGRIKITDKLIDLMPEYKNGEQDEWLMECTVEDALKMSVPMACDTYTAHDYNEWAWTFFNHPVRSKSVKPGGTVFSYCTAGTFILDVMVEKLTGMTFLEYLRPVFEKIGVSKDIWCVKAPDGYSWGGSGVVCTLRDFAKVGELIMHKGECNGEQLLPRWYMEKATTKQISNIQQNHFTALHYGFGYGYQIWITSHGFALSGMGSQLIFCFPDKDFMFVCQGDTQSDNDTDSDYMYEQICYEIYDHIKDEPLVENEELNKLRKEEKEFSLNVDYGDKENPFSKEINGKKYILNENNMGWKWFKIDFEGENGVLTYENKRGIKKIPFGMNSFLKSTFPETSYYDKQVYSPANRELDCISSASWTEEKKLLLRVYIIDTNFGSCFMTFGFKNNTVGIMMKKRAEFFLNDYVGFAGGIAQ